jgi:hypothetical protein
MHSQLGGKEAGDGARRGQAVPPMRSQETPMRSWRCPHALSDPGRLRTPHVSSGGRTLHSRRRAGRRCRISALAAGMRRPTARAPSHPAARTTPATRCAMVAAAAIAPRDAMRPLVLARPGCRGNSFERNLCSLCTALTNHLFFSQAVVSPAHTGIRRRPGDKRERGVGSLRRPRCRSPTPDGTESPVSDGAHRVRTPAAPSSTSPVRWRISGHRARRRRWEQFLGQCEHPGVPLLAAPVPGGLAGARASAVPHLRPPPRHPQDLAEGKKLLKFQKNTYEADKSLKRM